MIQWGMVAGKNKSERQKKKKERKKERRTKSDMTALKQIIEYTLIYTFIHK